MKLKEITDSYSKKYEAEDFKEAGQLAKKRKGGKFKLVSFYISLYIFNIRSSPI